MTFKPEHKMIPCDQIRVNYDKNVSRANLTPADCQDLADSIHVTGLIQPVTVREVTDFEGTYSHELCIGYRRYTAVSVILGHEEIACITTAMTDYEIKVANVVENLQRKDISYWEQCCGIKEAFPNDSTLADIARAVSYSSDWVRLRWAVWKLPQSIIDGVEAGVYGPAQVSVIIQQSPEDRNEVAKQLRKGMEDGKTVKDMQRSLTGRKNHRSKKEVKRVMTMCMESGHEGAVHALRYACGEISDTLLLELLDNPQ